MVITVHGTCGAGKSTLVRNIMARYPSCTPFYIDGRKKPIGYGCERPDTPPLWIVGHYEVVSGGADTIDDLDEIFRQVRLKASEGLNVLFEGLVVQYKTKQLIALHREFPLLVVALNTSVEDCTAGVNARRRARGDMRPFSPKYAIRKMNEGRRQRLILRDVGVDYRSLSREHAERVVATLLGLFDNNTSEAA